MTKESCVITDEQITIAVEWWTKALFRHSFDNGDPSPQGDMAMVLATLAAEKNLPTEAEASKFALALVGQLMSHPRDRRITLDCDYGPGRYLYEAAEQAGISSLVFPWKTTMWLELDGSVSVSEGYGRPVVVIKEKKEKNND